MSKNLANVADAFEISLLNQVRGKEDRRLALTVSVKSISPFEIIDVSGETYKIDMSHF